VTSSDVMTRVVYELQSRFDTLDRFKTAPRVENSRKQNDQDGRLRTSARCAAIILKERGCG